MTFLTFTRLAPRRAISCQIIYLVFFSVFLFYILFCLYSYITIFPTIYALNSSNFLHFFTNNNWIVAPNLLSAHFSIIELAIVLVTVSMHRAEQSPTTAFESCEKKKNQMVNCPTWIKNWFSCCRCQLTRQTNFFATHGATIFLLLRFFVSLFAIEAVICITTTHRSFCYCSTAYTYFTFLIFSIYLIHNKNKIIKLCINVTICILYIFISIVSVSFCIFIQMHKHKVM